MRNLTWSLIGRVSLLSLFTLGSLQAQILEEVVVTAQKREQDLQDVGIAVTAFSGEQQRALGFTSSLDLEMQTPGLMSFNFGNGGGSVMSIRGVGQLDFADHQEQSSAVFHDGAYNSYLGAVSFALYDIDRIEVLKGPQGSLFGRNATGGVLHVLSARPTREFEGYAEFQGGEFDNYRGELAISGPLTENLSARFSAVKDKADGFVKNSLGEDGHDKDNTNARLQLLWEGQDVEVLFKAEFGTYDNNNPTYITDRGVIHNDALTGPITGGLNDGLARIPGPNDGQNYADFCDNFWLAGGFDPNAPTNVSCLGTTVTGLSEAHRTAISEYTEQPLANVGNGAGGNGHSDRELWSVGGTITWDISDSLQVVSITDYRDFKKSYREDADGMDLFVSDFYIQDDSTQWSQELRLHGENDNLKWILGFYYLSIEHDMFGGLDSDPIFFSSTTTASELDTETYAFFGHGEYTVNDQVSVLVGLRWTEDEKDLFLDGRCTDAPFPGAAGTCDFFYGGLVNNNSTVNASRSEGEWSGTFELNYRPNDDWLLYAKYARGNKAGSFNTGFLTLFTPDAVEFDGEILTDYEVGFKSTFWDGKARLNGAAFYYDYEDFQSFFQLGLNFSVQNLDANAYGGELELILNPAEGWDILLGLSLLDATQEDVNNNVITRDRQMPFAPDVTFNGLVRYEWAAFANGMMNVQFDWNYRDDYTTNAIDHPALTEDGFWLANARIGWISGDGKWELSAWVKNLTNEDYYVNGFDTSTFSSTIIKVPGPPQQFGGTIRYNWGG